MCRYRGAHALRRDADTLCLPGFLLYTVLGADCANRFVLQGGAVSAVYPV